MSSDSRSHELWDDVWAAGAIEQWDTLSQEILNALHREIGQVRGKRILEAGSGTGRISLELARAGAELTLVDFSPVALQGSRQLFRAGGVAGRFVEADLKAVPLPDRSFDVIWSGGVLEHYDPPEQAALLREMARLLRPGGKLIMLTPYARCLPYRLSKWVMELVGRWRYGKEDPVWSLAPAFAEAGLTVASEYPVAPLTAGEWADISAAGLGSLFRCFATAMEPAEQGAAPGYLLCTVGGPAPTGSDQADLRGWITRQSPTVLMLSSVQWDDPWQRPQQLASRLARLGCRVLYVNSRRHLLRVESLDRVTDGFLREQFTQWLIQKTRWWRSVALIEPITGVTDGAGQIDATPLFVEALTRVFGLRSALVWAYHFIWNETVAHLRGHHQIVYDCVDDHVGLGGGSDQVEAAHQRLVALSDTLLLTSRPLLESPMGAHPHAHLVRNGVDLESFPLTQPRPDRSRLHVGFVGAISPWVDLDTVAQMARLRPDWQFTMVGPVYVKAHPLDGLENVALVGSVPHRELHRWHARFDAAIIPFRQNRVTECANPIKLYEYLASGLPVVSSPMPEVAALGDLVRIASSPEGFVQAVAELVAADSAALREGRRRAVASETWTRRAVDALTVSLLSRCWREERWAEATALLDLALAEQQSPALLLEQACLSRRMGQAEVAGVEPGLVEQTLARRGFTPAPPRRP
ncbi:MAG: methyltransferase domain-containing protein [Bacillota bacterium]